MVNVTVMPAMLQGQGDAAESVKPCCSLDSCSPGADANASRSPSNADTIPQSLPILATQLLLWEDCTEDCNNYAMIGTLPIHVLAL